MRPASVPIDCIPSCSGRLLPEWRPRRALPRRGLVIAQDGRNGRGDSARARSLSLPLSSAQTTPATSTVPPQPEAPERSSTLTGMPRRTLSFPDVEARPAVGRRKPLKINLDLALVSGQAAGWCTSTAPCITSTPFPLPCPASSSLLSRFLGAVPRSPDSHPGLPSHRLQGTLAAAAAGR